LALWLFGKPTHTVSLSCLCALERTVTPAARTGARTPSRTPCLCPFAASLRSTNIAFLLFCFCLCAHKLAFCTEYVVSRKDMSTCPGAVLLGRDESVCSVVESPRSISVFARLVHEQSYPYDVILRTLRICRSVHGQHSSPDHPLPFLSPCLPAFPGSWPLTCCPFDPPSHRNFSLVCSVLQPEKQTP
jgi:hypothetical protein